MKSPFLKTGKLARNFFRFGSINYFFSRQNKNFLEPRFADCKTRKFRNLKSRTELLCTPTLPYPAIKPNRSRCTRDRNVHPMGVNILRPRYGSNWLFLGVSKESIKQMKRKTLNLGGRLFSLEKPVVMGIMNITPDSFYSGVLKFCCWKRLNIRFHLWNPG